MEINKMPNRMKIKTENDLLFREGSKSSISEGANLKIIF